MYFCNDECNVVKCLTALFSKPNSERGITVNEVLPLNMRFSSQYKHPKYSLGNNFCQTY